MQTTRQINLPIPAAAEARIDSAKRKGPVVLDLQQMKSVAGGLPHGQWKVAAAADVEQLPHGQW